MRTAVVTVSTRVSRGEMDDASGERLAALVAEAGCEVVAREALADDRGAIAARLRAHAEAGVQLVVTTGGTGFTPDDLTPEATLDVIDREAPGIAEALRAASGRHGMLSRGVAGIAGRTLIVNLPGSPKAVEELFPVLAPALDHMATMLEGARH